MLASMVSIPAQYVIARPYGLQLSPNTGQSNHYSFRFGEEFPVSDDYEDLSEMVQKAFDKYMLDRIPGLCEKHLPLVDKLIENRINGNYTPELNKAFFARIESIVENTVGNHLRVGKGRDIIDSTVLRYLDKKLEEHIEQQVRYRLNRIVDRFKVKFDEQLKATETDR